MHSDTIQAIFEPAGGQWVAAFAGAPQVACGGPTGAAAARRLLETFEAPHGQYALVCDADHAGSSSLIRYVLIRDLRKGNSGRSGSPTSQYA